jgi:hypothetical protein
MSIEKVREVLLWCTVINYGILLTWGLIFILAHDGMNRLLRLWFRLSDEQMDALQFAGMTFYKVSIFLFNLAPCIALYIVH